jgi:hypothetical protein
MKRLLQLLGLCVVGLTSMRADAFTNDCNPCCNQSQWAIQAELLYFKTVTDQTAFAGAYDRFPGFNQPLATAQVFNNDPCYRPGFRIEADWTACDCLNQVQLRYVNLYNGHKRTVTNARLFQVVPSNINAGIGVGTAVSHVSSNYNAGDAVWQRALFNCCDFDLNFLLGLHGASNLYKEDVRIEISGQGTLNTINNNWKSQFWGVGPEVGLSAHYTLPCFSCLSLAGNLRGALLAGKTSCTYTTVYNQEGSGGLAVTFKNSPSNWGAVPSFDGRLGLNYAWDCFCFRSNLEIGYEMIWYSRAVNKIETLDAGLTSNGEALTNFYSDLSMHGPYAALRFSF